MDTTDAKQVGALTRVRKRILTEEEQASLGEATSVVVTTGGAVSVASPVGFLGVPIAFVGYQMAQHYGRIQTELSAARGVVEMLDKFDRHVAENGSISRSEIRNHLANRFEGTAAFHKRTQTVRNVMRRTHEIDEAEIIAINKKLLYLEELSNEIDAELDSSRVASKPLCRDGRTGFEHS